MFKKLGSILILLLFVVNVSAFAQVKIGYMNAQKVLNQMPQRSQVEQNLNDFIQQKRQELQQRTQAFQDSVAAYQQNKASMSKAQAQQEEQKLSQFEASVQQYQQNLQQQVAQRRNSLLQPLYDKMNEAMSTVAKKHDLDFVLNEATSTGENVVYYSSSDKLNITDEVIKQINGTTAKN